MTTQLKNPQTGLYIREFMEEILPREIARAQRHDRPLTIAMISLDKFHEIQDRYGPKVSAQVLAHVASRMHLALRQSDSIIGDWDNGEFLICLMECNLRGALSTLERLRSRASSEPVHVLVHQIPITISIGVATYRPGMKSEALIQEAQHTLNQARLAGHNQVCHLEL